MSGIGNVHLELIHRLFDEEITPTELVDTILWTVGNAEGQLILPNLTAPDSVMAREKARTPQSPSGINPAEHTRLGVANEL